MVVLKETFSSVRPDDDAVVGAACGKLLAIFLIGDAVYGLAVTTDLLDHFTRVCIIYEDSVSNRQQHLGTIYTICKSILSLYLVGSRRPKLSWSCWSRLEVQAIRLLNRYAYDDVLPGHYGAHIQIS